MGLKENLVELAAQRELSTQKRKQRQSNLVSLVSSISDPEPMVTEDVESSLPAVRERLAASVSGVTPPVGASSTKGVDPQFDKALQAMIKASGGKIKIGNSYRSPERQAQLWNAALKKYGSPEKARKWVAPPGKSNHGRGLAADLKYADAEVKKWAHANAAKYGLIFPMAHEDWHIEPVSARSKKR